ncbi:type IV fimbrial assembly protein PilC [Desulfocucumis palustris]|uniref:Type IV fimbrial assembly protein PilC n=1 Tax=Desulfocucumis palustris TaxID=1898651 RepID=A0A2L2XHD5_9FIRM|nr:type II secretion system F family protein [Desulfocucumis palustris]GBF35404.1 type IV fimbrial assembly protein PilC [Desulfocucumis palustris]
MAAYLYGARKGSGRFSAGLIRAGNKLDAAVSLKETGLFIIWLYSLPIPSNIPAVMRTFGVNKKRLYLFCKQLSSMLAAGVGLEYSLECLAQRTAGKSFNSAIVSVLTMLRKGTPFSRALAGHPVFPELMINMVRAGEMAGALEETLNDIADYYRRDNDFSAKIKSILIYPAFLLSATLVMIICMVDYVGPKYLSAYQQLGIAPPSTTINIMKIGALLKTFWPSALPAGIILYFLYKKIGVTETGARLFLAFPLAGRLSRYIALYRYCWVLGMLLERGVPFLGALQVSGRVPGNIAAGRAADRIIKGVTAGYGLSRVMALDSFFPPLLIQMVRVGEETGKISEALLKASRFYRGEARYLTRNIMAAVEPALILFMGGVIGFIVMAMLLPMTNLINSL